MGQNIKIDNETGGLVNSTFRIGNEWNSQMKLIHILHTTMFTTIFLSGCSSGIECEETSSFYKSFDSSNPSYEKSKEHIICRDSDGNII